VRTEKPEPSLLSGKGKGLGLGPTAVRVLVKKGLLFYLKKAVKQRAYDHLHQMWIPTEATFDESEETCCEVHPFIYVGDKQGRRNWARVGTKNKLRKGPMFTGRFHNKNRRVGKR